MSKQFKFLLCAFFLITNQLAFATPFNSNPESDQTPPCNYQAPTNFHVTLMGPDFADLAWVQGGAPPPSYNLKVFIHNTGTIVYNMNFVNFNTNTFRALGLPEGTALDFVLSPRCNDGTLGPSVICFGETIIMDLICTSFTPTTNTVDCQILQAGTSCEFPINQIAKFKICKKNYVEFGREFHVTYNGRFKVWITGSDNTCNNDPNLNQQFKFYCIQGVQTSSPDCSGARFLIKVNGNTIAKFSINQAAVNAQLYCDFLLVDENNYEFVHIDELAPLPIMHNPNNGGVGTNGSSAFVAPNPFSDYLNVEIPEVEENQPVTISLYDLQGRLLMTKNSEEGGRTQTLFTESLVPGMYFLRIDAGEIVNTVRVVKTQ